MFVLISLIVSVLVLIALFHFSKQRQTNLKRKFQLLVSLRALLQLCREHRNVTHKAISTEKFDESKVTLLQDNIRLQCQVLMSTAQFENRPMYRILGLKLHSLSKNWTEQTVARNQVIHGKAIRHCLFLMDEVVLAWLIEAGREELSDEYHLNWQIVLEAMEAVTQLRISFQDFEHHDGLLRSKFYSDRMRRKINQLAVICPLTVASPNCSANLATLSKITSQDSLTISRDELYQLTTDISLTICQVYDQMLNNLTETLYQPLPNLAMS
ncbi:hypothetical protein [Vibrio sonorensis]|uniref:hypothetical protein n=1 Tax=Vibrio sonorensis TaxID=1004316 RepID=UPI0008DA8E27|nr:hypothetical protein [Vibrio sonorensis]